MLSKTFVRLITNFFTTIIKLEIINFILFKFVYVINKEFYFIRITAKKVAFKKFVLLNIFFINCEKSKMARQFDPQTSSNV